MAFKLIYKVGDKVVQEWYFPNKQLCNWKKLECIKSGQYKLGIFKIIHN